MKLVLDGVFNHTGDSHPWFDRHRRGENGACHHPDSPYRGWFNFTRTAARSTGRATPACRSLTSPSRRWRKRSIAEKAAWCATGCARRTASTVGGWTWCTCWGERRRHRQPEPPAGIYQAVKQENPQAYVLGEHFGDARRWLHAGVEDAAMNYMGFALPVRAFLAGWTWPITRCGWTPPGARSGWTVTAPGCRTAAS